MIDLHCHMLPSIDDGAKNMDIALKMAEAAVADGITHTVCTPHIYPGVFENTHDTIRIALSQFRDAVSSAGIPLELSYGADIHVVPDLVTGLNAQTLPTLCGSRYFLLEPPHHVSLPKLDHLVYGALAAGYVPVITHPERLAYIEGEYDQFVKFARDGAWLQLTGGALLGRFGRRVARISGRFIQDGAVHLLASDGHNLSNRPPVLGEARALAAEILGEDEARRLVLDRPRAVLENADAAVVSLPPGLDGDTAVTRAPKARGSWLSRVFRK